MKKVMAMVMLIALAGVLSSCSVSLPWVESETSSARQETENAQEALRPMQTEAAPFQAQAAGVERWEYKVINTKAHSLDGILYGPYQVYKVSGSGMEFGENLIDYLDVLGSDGWELITVVVVFGDNYLSGQSMHYFKRRIP